MFDHVAAFCKVVASSVAKTKAVMLSLVGPGGEDEATGERATAQPEYGALGIIARPPAPSAAGYATALAVRTGEQMVPIAYRDLRLNANLPEPPDGSVALVGYGGSYDLHESTLSGSGAPVSSTRTMHVPYASGAKAHEIKLAGGGAVTITHADGAKVELSTTGATLTLGLASVALSPTGATISMGPTTISVTAAGVTISSATAITFMAPMVTTMPVGGTPDYAAMASKVDQNFNAIATLLGTGLAVSGPTASGTFTPSPVAASGTMVA
jgi:hypothetical protein